MSNELIQANQNNLPAEMPRRQMPGVMAMSINAGAVAIEQERAIAEAQGQLVLAKKFPRDLTAAHAELMTACKSAAFAAQAFYSVPNRGKGPSIRFAEEVARVYGNFQYGHRELSRSDGKSEVEVFAWDMQNNNRSIRQITVHHVRYSKEKGNTPLKDPTDIDNLIANVASKQIRGRILALMPKWLVADAIEECQKTLAGNNSEPFETRVRRMTQAFTQFGVTVAHLEAYLGHSVDKIVIDELIDLQGVFNALRDGAPASEYFGAAEKEAEADEAAASLAATAKAGKAAAGDNKQAARPAAGQQRAAAATQDKGKAEAAAPAQPAEKAAEKPQETKQEAEPGKTKGKGTPAEKQSTPAKEPEPVTTEDHGASPEPADDGDGDGEDLF